jgi:hypothetical protein
VAKAEIVTISHDDPRHAEVTLRMLNPWSESVDIGVCSAPIRLSGVTAYLEKLTNKEWKMVGVSKNAVRGDLPPIPFEIKAGAATEIPYSFDPIFMGLSSKAKLRVVVLARTKGGTVRIGTPSPMFVTESFTIPIER